MNSLKANIIDFICRNFQISDEDTSYHSLSQNGWDTLGSPCRLNVGVQDFVTEPR